MMSALKALFVRHATVVAYMLQSTEYEVGPYLKWYWRTQNFANVMHRRVLDRTRRARLLHDALLAGMILQFCLGLSLVVAGIVYPDFPEAIYFGLALLISYPIVWAHLVVVPLWLAKWLVVKPADKRAVERSEKIFANHPGQKIAVAGSYGKTTMKEMLATILAEGKKIAATPANKNVAISHAQFAHRLQGDEDILVIEYGEGAPGDIARFATVTHPDYALITGVAPAHLDKYGTLEAAARDIFSIADYVPADHLMVNAESPATKPYVKPEFGTYTQTRVKDWKVSDLTVAITGTDFILSRGTTKIALHSGLLGRHQVGPLGAAVVLGLELGLTPKQLIAGVAKTLPFPHRMQPYSLGGAWIIDDTYNGNLEGIRAGTTLLRELEAKRKWYVTPGLVDQGKDTARIHEEVGTLIAAARPDVVVLMQNSVTEYIQKGLQKAKFVGEVRVEPDPLAFYTSLEHFVTPGDVVLMQNDWTDNYA